MIRTITSLSLISLLASCSVISPIADRFLPERAEKDAEFETSGGVLTREVVDASQIAMISARTSPEARYPVYFVAQSDSNGTISYGKSGRQAVTLRGGLVNGQYIMGNDLLGVTPNSNDPIQYPKPLNAWPSQISRTYQLPGDGLTGDLREVQCQYQTEGEGVVEIVEMQHETTLISEKCAGDDLEFENAYMVDANGFVWKSEQWAGHNPSSLIIEIVEPLD